MTSQGQVPCADRTGRAGTDYGNIPESTHVGSGNRSIASCTIMMLHVVDFLQPKSALLGKRTVMVTILLKLDPVDNRSLLPQITHGYNALFLLYETSQDFQILYIFFQIFFLWSLQDHRDFF